VQRLSRGSADQTEVGTRSCQSPIDLQLPKQGTMAPTCHHHSGWLLHHDRGVSHLPASQPCHSVKMCARMKSVHWLVGGECLLLHKFLAFVQAQAFHLLVFRHPTSNIQDAYEGRGFDSRTKAPGGKKTHTVCMTRKKKVIR
jgi:hypothetical protein